MLGGLIVDPGRMEQNLGMTHGLIVAEAVMMGLAPFLGRRRRTISSMTPAARRSRATGRFTTCCSKRRRSPARSAPSNRAR